MSDPGNTLATAQVIAIGATSQPFTNTVTTANSEDYYRFTLSGRSSVNLTLTELDGNADLQLLNEAGTVLQQSSNTGTTAEVVNLTDLSAGVYYIRVFAASGTTSAHYTLAPQALKDAQADLLWRNYSTGENALWTMQDTTRVSSVYLQAVGDPNWKLEGAADFTGDGQAELVWRNYSTGENVLWQMNGTTAATSLALPTLTDTHWHIVSVNDFNGDAQADLIWRNYSTGENAVWQMNGTTLMEALVLPAVADLNWQLVGSGDFSRDGQTDLVWRNYSTGQNDVWYMRETTYVESVNLNPIHDVNWRIEGVADFNGDNHPDLVWRRYSTGENSIWHMQGTTRLEGVYFDQISDLNWQIAAPFVSYGDPGVADTAGNATATAFDIGTLSGQATYTGTVNSSDTNDYYRFTLPVAAPNFVLALKGLSGDADLQLLDGSGSSLQASSQSGTTAELIQRSLAAGTYYLRVYPGITGASVNYTLGLSFDAAPPTVTVGLANDTASSGTNTDGRTADPTITAQIGTERTLGHLRAGFNNTLIANYTDVAVPLQAGSVTLSPTQLQAINGGLPLIDGVYVLHLRATGVEDALVTTTDLTFTLDTTTSAPSDLHLTTGTGNTTNVTTPTVTGQAEVGAVVKVYGAGNVLLGQGVTDSNGSWQATLSSLTDGTYQVTAIATDAAGNVSAASTVLSLVVDTALPTLSVTTPLTTPLVSSTRLTGTVAGTGSAIVTISYYFDERPAITLAFDPATGTFDQALDFTDLASGAHTLTLTTTDTAGNVKTLQAPVTVALGAAPVITAALVEDTAPAGFTNEDGITSNPTISGQVTTTQPLSVLRAGFGTGASVNYVDITTQLQPDGSFTLNRTQLETLYGGTLVDADYTLSLQAVDTVGNVTTPLVIAFDLDTQAPTAPSNLSLVPAGMYAVAITGTAEAGAQVQLFAGTTLIGEAVANATGNWRVTTSQLRNGTHSLTATASDAAGNTSPATTATDVTITTLVPSTPQELRLTALTDSGQSTSDNITNIATPTIVGTTEAGATVRLFRAQQLLGETIADATGTWSIALTTALPEGEQSLSVVAHNAIGDSQTATLLTTIDTVAPTTTQLNVLATGSTTATALANGVTLTTGTRLLGQVNGTTSAVASLQYQLGTSPAVTVPVATNGLFNYRLDLAGSSSGDDQMLTVTMTDVAGNTTTLAPYLVNISATNDGGGEAPVLLAQLMQDTGSNTTDGWTSVPGVAGVASAPGVITTLLATFDTATNAVFQDLSDLLQPDGTFTLDEETLTALAGGDLADGAYTLRLRVQADTNQTAEQVVSLTLDRTAPVTTLPNLVDGIAWSRDTHLQGTVVEASEGVEVAYQLETVNGVSVGSTHTLTVTDQSFDQMLDAATLTEETPYNLVLTSTDRAGNTQRSRFQFLIPGARKVTDDDAWHSQIDPPRQEPNASDVATWGYVGEGGGWGYNSGSGGWAGGYGGSLTPEAKEAYQDVTGGAYEHEYNYAESLAAIARNAVDLISTSPATINAKGALFNRRVLLEMLGNRVQELIDVDGDFTNDQALLKRLSPALEGLFADAYNPSGAKAGVFASFVPWGAAWLAQGLVSDALSVRVQVFQATLLEVVTEATLGITDVNQQEALTAAVMALAKTYAWLNPNPEATVPAADKDFGFLDALWRLQIPNAITGVFKGSTAIAQTLEESVAALKRLLEGVQDPVRAIQFLNNLVQAASNVTSLQGDVKDAQFLRTLVEFGVEFVKLNPVESANTTETSGNTFLNTFWSESTQYQKQAQGDLNSFFKDFETLESKNKFLNYEVKMLQATKKTSSLHNDQIWQDSGFLNKWLDIGRIYLLSDPLALLASGQEPENFFANTFWRNDNGLEVTEGAIHLDALLMNFEYTQNSLVIEPVLAFNPSPKTSEFSQENQTPLIAGISIDELLCKVGIRRKATAFEPVPKSRNGNGLLTDGRYTVLRSSMEPHETGYPDGTSQFLAPYTGEAADTLVLDAARLADQLCLWTDGGRKAKVQIVNSSIGTIGRTGILTNWITIHRRANGMIHGHPSSGPTGP